MARKATGSVYKSNGKWYVAVSVGTKKAHFVMDWAKDDGEANLRRAVVAQLVSDLRKAGLDHMVRTIGERAAQADAVAVLDIVNLVNGLTNGTEQPLPKPLAGVLAAPTGLEPWTVQMLGEHWTSNRLAEESGGEVKPIGQAENRRKLEKHVYPIMFEGRPIGDIPVAEFTAAHAKHITRQATLPQGSKRAVGQCIKRMFKLAAEVMEILPESPLRSWKLPGKNDELDGAYLFPDEDALLLACKEVPLVKRLFFGLAAREGIRRGRIVTLRWDSLRLSEHGYKGVARVPGKPNKRPANWVLTDGTAEALRRWRRICPSEAWVFPAEALPRYRRYRSGQPLSVQHFADDLRESLKVAGVTRPELFESEGGFRRLVGHDLRATYVTLARANGESDAVIRRRTRHTTTSMIDRYDHAVGLFAELDCGMLAPLHEAIPELAEMEPSEEWVEVGLATPSGTSIVGESSEKKTGGKNNR